MYLCNVAYVKLYTKRFRIQTCMKTKYKVQMLGYRNRKAAISASKYKGDIPSDKNMCF